MNIINFIDDTCIYDPKTGVWIPSLEHYGKILSCESDEEVLEEARLCRSDDKYDGGLELRRKAL